MDELSRDERMRSLQRLAYGAVASDAERAAALAELERLRREREAASLTDISVPALAVSTPPQMAHVVTSAGDADASARRLRLAIVVGAAALVVGVAVGWQAGSRSAHLSAETVELAEATFSGPRTQADALAAMPAAEETGAAEVFLRPPTPEDVPREGLLGDFGNGELEFRLLATGPEGQAIYAARDSAELCLYVSLGATAATATCTTQGRFPEEGLTLTDSVYGAGPGVDATWHTDGSLQLRSLAG